MDIHDTRQMLRSKSIYDIPMRVTFYARVSSESDEQLNSLGNQISYYEEFIRKNPAWDFVPGYIDEGLSGISTKHRENFHRMIDDASEGLFDMVITKEISRFARNTLDSIQFTRELLSDGVAVFFQNDNINTLDEDSELRLSIMSSIAQDELRKLSSRVRFGHQQAIKHDVVLGNDNLFGYKKQNGRMRIDEPKAKMVRQLYELYATGEYSLRQIENILYDKGYRNSRGNKILHTTLSNILSNPKYKGYYVGNKVRIVDMFTQKQKFLPQDQWVMHKDETGKIVPAIVSEELWERANKVLSRRSVDVKNRKGICNHTNLMTGKLFCSCCGSPYYRRDARDRWGEKCSRWVCSGKSKNGADYCSAPAIYERDLKPVLLEVFKDTETNTEALIDSYTKLYKEVSDTDKIKKQMKYLKGKIDKANLKKSKLLEYNVAGQMTDKDFLALTAQANEEIEKAEADLAELENRAGAGRDFKKHMDVIRTTLQHARESLSSGIVNRQFVDEYIERIDVIPEEDGKIRLAIRICTGEATQKYLKKLNIRMGQINEAQKAEEKSLRAPGTSGDDDRAGHTFKKMIEAYEQGMQ